MGFGVIVRGRRILRRFPQLLTHLWRPVLYNTLLSTLALLIWLLVWWALSQWMIGLLAAWLKTWLWPTLLTLVSGLTILILGLASALVALVIWRLVQGFLLSPIYADLSLRVEKALGTPKNDLRELSWLQAIPDTLIEIGILLVLQVISLSANSIPIVGSVIATVINFAGTTSILGLDLFSFPLSARGASRWQQFRYLTRHSWECSGVGTSLLLAQTVPILGGLLTTYAVMGCTELFHELNDHAKSLEPAQVSPRADEVRNSLNLEEKN